MNLKKVALLAVFLLTPFISNNVYAKTNKTNKTKTPVVQNHVDPNFDENHQLYYNNTIYTFPDYNYVGYIGVGVGSIFDGTFTADLGVNFNMAAIERMHSEFYVGFGAGYTYSSRTMNLDFSDWYDDYSDYLSLYNYVTNNNKYPDISYTVGYYNISGTGTVGLKTILNDKFTLVNAFNLGFGYNSISLDYDDDSKKFLKSLSSKITASKYDGSSFGFSFGYYIGFIYNQHYSLGFRINRSSFSLNYTGYSYWANTANGSDTNYTIQFGVQF